MASYQQVDVYVLNSETREPVSGVLVRVYDKGGTMLYTEGTTDSAGRAGFLLYTLEYSLRFYKFKASVQQPQLISVQEGPNGAPLLNSFQVYAQELNRPVSRDPLLCRASGYFRTVTGQAHSGLDIIFTGAFGPVLLDQAGVLPDKRAIRTDGSGYACIDLIRCAKYSVTVEAWEDQGRTVSVPDSSSVNLPDLLFAVVSSISYLEALPTQLSIGSTLSITPSVRTSSGILLEGTALSDVTWEMSDKTVVSLTANQTQLSLRGLKAGTTTLRASRRDKTIVQIPYVTYILGSEVQISVV